MDLDMCEWVVGQSYPYQMAVVNVRPQSERPSSPDLNDFRARISITALRSTQDKYDTNHREQGLPNGGDMTAGERWERKMWHITLFGTSVGNVMAARNRSANRDCRTVHHVWRSAAL